MVGWIAFSVIVGVGEAFGGNAPMSLQAFVYLFGILFFFSLPVAVIAEIVRWRKRKSKPASV